MMYPGNKKLSKGLQQQWIDKLVLNNIVRLKQKNGGKFMKKLHLKAALVAGATVAMSMSGCSSKAGTGGYQ